MKAETKLLGVKLFDTDVKATAKMNIPEFVAFDFPGIQISMKNKVKVFGLTMGKHKMKLSVSSSKAKSGPLVADITAGS